MTTLAIVPNPAFQQLALATVLRAPQLKSPIIGIPRPGFPPLAFNREIIANCVRGLTVTRVEFNEQLIIEGTREHGRGCYKLNPLQVDYLLRERVHKWAAQQRRSGVLSGGERQRVKGSKYAIRIRDTKAAIAKLEARMNGTCHRYADRIDKPVRPVNPILREASEWEKLTENGRARILAWYREKPQRKVISSLRAIYYAPEVIRNRVRKSDALASEGWADKPWRQAKRILNAEPSLQPFYKALTAAGFTVKRLSEAKRTIGGKKSPSHADYVVSLYEYCGLIPKPVHELEAEHYGHGYGEVTKAHYDRKQEYVTELREWQSAQQEIAGLRDLLASHEQDAAREAASV